MDDKEAQNLMRFSMDGDFEGGQWIDGEFYFDKQKKRKHQSKEQALYGVFADDSDDDDKPGRKKKGGVISSDGGMKTMNFVSGGTVAEDNKEKGEDKEEPAAPDAEMDAADEEDAAPRGLGFKRQKSSQAPAEPQESEETVEATRAAAAFMNRRQQRREAAAAAAAASSMPAPTPLEHKEPPKRPNSNKKVKLDKDFGQFEKHTKGIGLKLLQKMGFTGRLGRDAQGISTPIMPKLRPRNMGLSYNNFKEVDTGQRVMNRQQAEEKAKEEAEKKATAKAAPATGPQRGAWKRTARVKKVYKTASEVIAESEAGPAAATAAPQVVLDLRGPMARYTSLDKIVTEEADEEKSTGRAPASTVLPELTHNLNLLVELTEAEIHRIGRELSHQRDSMLTLAHERDVLQSSVAREAAAVERADQIVVLIDSCEQRLRDLTARNAPAHERIESVAAVFDVLQHKYKAECRTFDLVACLVGLVTPAMRMLFLAWDPLHDVQQRGANATAKPGQPGHAHGHAHGGAQAVPHTQAHAHPPAPAQVHAHAPSLSPSPVYRVLSHWRLLLSGETDAHGTELLAKLLKETLMPRLRLLISSNWRGRDYLPLTVMLDHLKPLVPNSIYVNLVTQLILPKLKYEVEQWTPRNDPVPIHVWLHPWLPYIPEDMMQPLYAIIRYKLGIALQEWHPSDGSAYIVLSPWHQVFSEADFAVLLGRTIFPKLQAVLRTEFDVNPHKQGIEPFKWAMSWVPLFNPRLMVELLLSEFFPKWFRALYAWLNARPDFHEVSGWYLGWKSMFPESLREHPTVKAMLLRGLELMNAAMVYQPLDGMMNQIMHSLNPGQLYAAPAVASVPVPVPPSPSVTTVVDESKLTFKDIISQYAQLNNIEFVPNVARGYHDGKQIFSFGGVSIYLDNQSIYAFEPSTSEWRALSMAALLTRARDKVGQQPTTAPTTEAPAASGARVNNHHHPAATVPPRGKSSKATANDDVD